MDELTDALDAMVWQFAYRGVVKGKRVLTTGGLSALEEAFEALGWDDPHEVSSSPGCAVEGCPEWGEMGTPDPDGPYRFYCGKHVKEYQAMVARDREASYPRGSYLNP